MRFFSLPNLSSQDITEADPREVKRLDFETKEEFRAWCNDIKTNHCFYSHTEALTPSLRVTVSNTPFYLHGFTADYDSEISQSVAICLVSKNAPAGLIFVSSNENPVHHAQTAAAPTAIASRKNRATMSFLAVDW